MSRRRRQITPSNNDDNIDDDDVELAKTKWLTNLNNNDDTKNDDDNAACMKGKKFVTLATDVTTGSTEVFQLSDISVQMDIRRNVVDYVANDNH